MTTTITRTHEVLAEMMTENTGRHILDSGDAYGRHWQRNAGMTAHDFAEAPKAWADKWGGITLSVFHYLADRLSYIAEMDKAFQDFADADTDSGWLSLMESFALEHDSSMVSWNTYNGEDWLSQTLQGVTFAHDGSVFALIQIHGGADVRGGYTRPRVFRVDVDSAEYFPYDNASAELACPENHDHGVSVRYGEVISAEGYSRDMPEHDGEVFRCSECAAVMTVHAPEPY